MAHYLRPHSHIVVADPCPRDYHMLTVLAGEQSWHVHLLTSGRAALRLSDSATIDLWMVNVSLPDLSGWELLQALRERNGFAQVFIVADEYRPEQERIACELGAGLYLAKAPDRVLNCRTILRSLCRDPCLNGEPIGES